jgi:hypothetical protein
MIYEGFYSLRGKSRLKVKIPSDFDELDKMTLGNNVHQKTSIINYNKE